MSMPKVGELAPEFQLLDAAGKRVALTDFRGQRVVLYFFVKANTSG